MGKITKIGEIEYKDIIVPIYNDPNCFIPSNIQVIFQARNANSYQGIIYVDGDKITYSEGVVIPERTVEDAEMLPKAVLTGIKVVNDDFIELLITYLDIEYKKRNSKENIREIAINKILK